jgi:hypothetical protein
MALRDYYQEKWAHTGESDADKAKAASDAWALTHINVLRLQPISEAFDDDASGFVTVGEVNAFTASRPLDWTLLTWLAYWAIGEQAFLSPRETRPCMVDQGGTNPSRFTRRRSAN